MLGVEGMETFSFGDVNYDHVIGDRNCVKCWTFEGPELHECGTEGCLKHNQFGDENADCDYWLYYMGDLCREW